MANQTRPLIGLNADFTPTSKQAPSHLRLNAGYVDAVLAAHGLPIVMPPINKESEINAFLDRIDGFILTGGRDIDPRKQGWPNHPATQPLAERRDDNDRILVRRLLH